MQLDLQTTFTYFKFLGLNTYVFVSGFPLKIPAFMKTKKEQAAEKRADAKREAAENDKDREWRPGGGPSKKKIRPLSKFLLFRFFRNLV